MNRRRIAGVLLSALLALCFSLVFYAFNTPVGPSIGSDNAMYLTMGTALARGYAPYTEIFDHKGPVLFLLQLLPQALSGGYSTLAVFLQEVVVLFLCLRLVSRVARETGAPELPAEILYLSMNCSLAGGGNLTEEYTALPTLCGILLILRAFSSPDPSGKAETRLFPRAAALGALSMLVFLVRANNALPLFCMTAGLSLFLLTSRRFRDLGRCAAGFPLGALAALLPVCLWLLSRGALSAAWYGAVIHNFMYSSASGGSRLHALLHEGYGRAATLFLLLASAGAVCCLRRRSYALFPAFLFGAAGGFLAAFISRKFYDHYLMIAVPLALTGACLFLASLPRRTRNAAVCLCLLISLSWLAVKGKRVYEWRLSERADLPVFTENARSLYERVPEKERDRFMAYRVEPRWYAVTGALPCIRFYFLQETLAEVNPAVMDEIVETFRTHPPLWLVIYYNRAFSPPYDPRMAEIFETGYEFVAAAGEYQLRRLKQNAAP